MDRKAEVPVLPPELKGIKMPTTKEEGFKIAEAIKDLMVGFAKN